MGRDWVKFHCKGWLDGTMSYELNDPAKGVWAGLINLAGDYCQDGKREPGFIPLDKESVRRRLTSRNVQSFNKSWALLIATQRIREQDGGLLVVKFAHHNPWKIPSRQQLWDDENPEKAAERKRRHQTTRDDARRHATDPEREREKEGEPEKEPSSSPLSEADAELFKVYEENIGMLTPIIGDKIADARGQYGSSWVTDAIKESVSYEKRSWAYCAKILERWKREGRGDKKKAEQAEGSRGVPSHYSPPPGEEE